MSIFINGMGGISAQKTFDNKVLQEGVIENVSNKLPLVEPNYSEYIPLNQLRRLSKVVRMGITSALIAIKDGGIEKPDGIIVGTGMGCLEDTITFLRKLIENKEELGNPTAFIHSTHNTISSQIALNLKCYGYNSTYVHRNISFESALFDACLQLDENEVNSILVGGVDEVTKESYDILQKLYYYKKEEINSKSDLYSSSSRGSIAGEGSFFFTLENKPTDNSYCEVLTVENLSLTGEEKGWEELKNTLNKFNIETPDLIITGRNGCKEDNSIYNAFESKFESSSIINYKHLSGEYNTASAFAVWMASLILKENKNLSAFTDLEKKSIKNILIYNQTQNLHHSFILLRAC